MTSPDPTQALRELAEYIAVSLNLPDKARHIESILLVAWHREVLASPALGETAGKEPVGVGCSDYTQPAHSGRVHVFHDGSVKCECGEMVGWARDTEGR